ncbi:hypothetical protein L1887_32751 [Cichorium endivia]|nr:hypothetical protein L1887_32751 [Cichorium endivia]
MDETRPLHTTYISSDSFSFSDHFLVVSGVFSFNNSAIHHIDRIRAASGGWLFSSPNPPLGSSWPPLHIGAGKTQDQWILKLLFHG